MRVIIVEGTLDEVLTVLEKMRPLVFGSTQNLYGQPALKMIMRKKALLRARIADERLYFFVVGS